MNKKEIEKAGKALDTLSLMYLKINPELKTDFDRALAQLKIFVIDAMEESIKQ